MYLASGGQLLYTPSVECVVGCTIRETQPVCSEIFCHFLITSCWKGQRKAKLESYYAQVVTRQQCIAKMKKMKLDKRKVKDKQNKRIGTTANLQAHGRN